MPTTFELPVDGELYEDSDPRYRILLARWERRRPTAPPGTGLFARLRWGLALWLHEGRRPETAEEYYNRSAW